MDMEMEHPRKDQETEFMLKETKVTPQASPTPIAEEVSSEQLDTILLEENLGIDVYTIAFDESQHRSIQSHRACTPNQHASPMHLEKLVIM